MNKLKTSVEVLESPKRTRPVVMSVAELIDRECAKRKCGYVKATGRKDPVLALVTYVPLWGKRQGIRGEFAMIACGVYETGRSAFLKPLDENGNIINKYIYRVREWEDENFSSLKLL